MKNRFLNAVKVLMMAGLLGASVSLANQAPEGWFVRIIAESSGEGLADRGTVLGKLSDSSDQYDSHDLPELAPFSDPYLTVVFKRTDWGDKNGEYNSDFRAMAARDVQNPTTWEFTVKSDDPNRDVTLKWESEARLDKMLLVDMETGLEIHPVIGGLVKDYQFNMGGKTERNFIWKY